jgi:hypothetical protein
MPYIVRRVHGLIGNAAMKSASILNPERPLLEIETNWVVSATVGGVSTKDIAQIRG